MSITLKAARSNKNMTQKELSERLGISEGTLRNYERGITFPNAETIQKIVSELEIQYDDIIFLPQATVKP